MKTVERDHRLRAAGVLLRTIGLSGQYIGLALFA